MRGERKEEGRLLSKIIYKKVGCRNLSIWRRFSIQKRELGNYYGLSAL